MSTSNNTMPPLGTDSDDDDQEILDVSSNKIGTLKLIHFFTRYNDL